jgi:deoxyribodipyrimidine photo-lyase
VSPLPSLPGALGYAFNPAAKCHKDRVRVLKPRSAPAASSSPSSSSAAAASRPGGPVIYWMSRDQRVCDNWAFTHAQELAAAAGSPLVVVFCLLPSFLGANIRAYGFMLRGLAMVERDLAALCIPFRLLLGEPVQQVAGYAHAIGAGAVVCDFSPLRIARAWKTAVGGALGPGCELREVDAHNIVPAWAASDKVEVGARTLRTKIHTALYKFCELSGPQSGFPAPLALAPTLQQALEAAEEHAGLKVWTPFSAPASGGGGGSSSGGGAGGGVSEVRLAPRAIPSSSSSSSSSSSKGGSSDPSGSTAAGLTQWSSILPHLRMDYDVPEVTFAQPGERAGRDALQLFLLQRLKKYAEVRNDPTHAAGTSNLSAHIHYGHISAQRAIFELSRLSGLKLQGLFPSGGADSRGGSAASFAEELVVRRELADNFCLYQPAYDTLAGASAWAQQTLNDHRGDKRSHVYSTAQFDAGETHEGLWNAMQMELVHRGKLAGWCRMYWAKKILEWSASPEEALRTAIALNDKYNLDGRDPNGYVGCMWAIAGVHDMGWTPRNVFGKIRFMNLTSTLKKFDTKCVGGSCWDFFGGKAIPSPWPQN